MFVQDLFMVSWHLTYTCINKIINIIYYLTFYYFSIIKIGIKNTIIIMLYNISKVCIISIIIIVSYYFIITSYIIIYFINNIMVIK